MKKSNPFSAIYFLKNNKFRAAICIFMIFISGFIFLGGNYVSSEMKPFDKNFEYLDKVVYVTIEGNEKGIEDMAEFKKVIASDERLDYVDVSAYGYYNMAFDTVMKIQMYTDNMTFLSVEDMEKVFERLGITGDFSNCKNGSIIISSNIAANRGLKLGNKINNSVDSNITGEYTLDAIIDDDSSCIFYVEDTDNPYNMYIFSDSMEGRELYDYVRNIAASYEVLVQSSGRDKADFDLFYIIFYVIVLLVGLVLSVTSNSVLKSMYIKREHEFGIYKAIGMGKKAVWLKVVAEILLMDVIALIICGIVTEFYTFMINELYYSNIGLGVVYCSKLGLIGVVATNVMIVIPMILIQGRRMNKANVTE